MQQNTAHAIDCIQQIIADALSGSSNASSKTQLMHSQNLIGAYIFSSIFQFSIFGFNFSFAQHFCSIFILRPRANQSSILHAVHSKP